jgi:alpha-tubulin suppressor-like RCC1 family protein
MKKILLITISLLIMLMSSITANAIEVKNMQVVTNGDTTFLIESNGNVKGWGRNTKGEVGNGTTTNQYAPIPIEGLSNIKKIIPSNYGYGFFFAIDNDGLVYGWVWSTRFWR